MADHRWHPLLAILVLAVPVRSQGDARRTAEEGRIHLEAGRSDEALSRFRDAQIERPESPELKLDVGLALYRLGRMDEAVAAFADAALGKDREIEGLARFHLGCGLFRQGSLDAALAAFNEALRLRPDDADAKHNRDVVILHIRERERQKHEEEKKNELLRRLEELVAVQTAFCRSTREVAARANIAAPPPAVEELAGQILAPAETEGVESRPGAPLAGAELAKAAADLAALEDNVADSAREVRSLAVSEAESRAASAPAGGGGPDPEVLRRVGSHLETAIDAMARTSGALRETAIPEAIPAEEAALRSLLDAILELADELTRIIRDQSLLLRKTAETASEAGIALPETAPAAGASDSRPASAPASRPIRLSEEALRERSAEMSKRQSALGTRTETFSGQVEGMLAARRQAESGPTATQPSAGEGPPVENIEKALAKLHEASDHMARAASRLTEAGLEPAFESEVGAMKALLEAKRLLSPPGGGQDAAESKPDETKGGKDEKDRSENRTGMTPEEVQAELARQRQREKEARARRPAKSEGRVAKDW